MYSTCANGITGVNCSVDVDECAASPNPCVYGTCANQIGTFKCKL